MTLKNPMFPPPLAASAEAAGALTLSPSGSPTSPGAPQQLAAQLGRRAFLVSTASTIAAGATIGPRAIAAAASDSELVDLASELIEVAQRYDLAVDEQEAAWDRRLLLLPEVPRELLITRNDVLFIGVGNSNMRAVPARFSEDRIEQLRTEKIRKVRLLASGGTRRIADKASQKRADEIVAAWDRLQGEIEKADEVSGHSAKEREADALFDHLCDLSDRSLALRATGIDELAAKAVIQIWHARGGEEPSEGNWEERFARSIAEDFQRIRGATPLFQSLRQIRYLDGKPIERLAVQS